ncbi:MAG: copper resistance protein CopC [Anaerolineaceae bacterium]|nr:copper resistance protein CopC [Anaerolineaceae bacterium]
MKQLSVLGSVGLLLGMVTAVSAHTVTLIESIPEEGAIVESAPDSVRAVFDEELLEAGSTIEVFASSGTQVDAGDGAVDLNDPNHASLAVAVPDLADGIYTVYWQATLLDGDVSEGTFNFTVGQAAAGERPFQPTTASEAGAAQFNYLLLGAAAVFMLLLLFLFNRRRQQALQVARPPK